MLLRFRVANHRSIRDEQTFSLIATPRRGEPRAAKPLRVVGVYGANASGKSNVLAALDWMIKAIKLAHTRWEPAEGVPRQPFKLSPTGPGTPSFFEVDFLHEGVRHSYGFEADDRQIIGEWLNTYPSGRPKKLFERDGAAEFSFGRSLTGELQRIRKLTRPNSLYLSCAASNNHPVLGAVHASLTQRVSFVQQDHKDQERRLLLAKYLLGDPAFTVVLNTLLRAADLGVEGAEVIEAPDETKFKEFAEQDPEFASHPEFEAAFRAIHAKVVLRRSSSEVRLSLDEESAGTRAWLSLIGHAMLTLRGRGVLVADEIDSSLHPLLSSTLIRMFKDSAINRHGSQLVFASHDTTLLGSLLEEEILARDEVWFTEKDDAGATSLYSLAEFHPRRDENIERGYLQGRYGAVPYLSFERIREILLEGIEQPR
jgi:energy-coupling factor transporter ATP-binding protein EcfA2